MLKHFCYNLDAYLLALNVYSYWLIVCLGFHAGIVEPIKSGIRDPKLGIGKQEEDDYYTAEENIQRKKLDVEVEDTEEQAKKREVWI